MLVSFSPALLCILSLLVMTGASPNLMGGRQASSTEDASNRKAADFAVGALNAGQHGFGAQGQIELVALKAVSTQVVAGECRAYLRSFPGQCGQWTQHTVEESLLSRLSLCHAPLREDTPPCIMNGG